MSLSQDALSISTENHLARWNATLPTGTPIVITYSFMTTLTAYDVRTTTAVTPYSERQKQGVRDAFDTWEEVSGLTFLEIDRGGDMRISMIGEDDMASISGRPAGGDANDLLAAPLSGASGVVPISVLTFNTRNSDIRSVAGMYDPVSNEATVSGNGYKVAAQGNRYAGKLISGGDNLVAVVPTPNGMIPASGSATMRGSGDVIYVNTPTSQVFTGVMDATVTANFTQESVNITMSNPVGQIDGVAYSGGGIIAINELALSGGVYQDDNRTTGSVTGFSGAADLNSGSQIVNALGVIGGPNAEETAAIAQINDRSNGTAIMRITAQE
jgi:hypothetical protein